MTTEEILGECGVVASKEDALLLILELQDGAGCNGGSRVPVLAQFSFLALCWGSHCKVSVGDVYVSFEPV